MPEIRKLLIANRGEIARRIIRSAHALGIATVAVHSDADAQALHVREATQALRLGGEGCSDEVAESYLHIGRLIDAARHSGADAIHPGYGFLSENAEFAQAVIDAGLIWVGPPPSAIRALGSKASAKALAQAHGVPCLPGYFGEDQRDETFLVQAERIGLPIMVKAVAGGGGRGIRLVTEMAQLLPALQSARSEAAKAFGNGDLLIERALLDPRHVEVQVFADAHGHCIHLGERDCSVQRRHQKIIEEAPSPAVDEPLREALGRCAVALAQAAGYVGAGTVEFLLEDGRFVLMEMNTRLQVEHPVTELITGLDLVEWQLRVARGEPLPLRQDEVQRRGHAIEVRLCAEDAHHRPQTGRVQAVHLPAEGPGLRLDHALFEGLMVTPHYDSMLGKWIAHGATRGEAMSRLQAALAQTQVLGLPTNRCYLAACLAQPQFIAGQARIGFLHEAAQDIEAALAAPADAPMLAALAISYPSYPISDPINYTHCQTKRPPADRLEHPHPRPLCLRQGADGRPAVQAVNISVRELGAGQVSVECGKVAVHARFDGQAWHINGQRRALHAVCVSDSPQPRWHVQVDAPMEGRTSAWELWVEDLSHAPPQRMDQQGIARDLQAPFNGRLIALPVQPGDAVQRGQVLAVIESMKLEHAVSAPADAIIATLAVTVGQQVRPGQVLILFEPAASESSTSP